MKKFENIISEINESSLKQKEFKENRKTVNFMGVRKHEPEDACFKHTINRDYLCHLYQAYSIIRGVEAQKHKNKQISQSRVEKLVEKFK